jgi:hypothetical protein
MLNLHKRLTEKTYGDPPKNLSGTTASAYIKTMTILNGKLPFKNLNFLKKTEEIEKKVGEYAESTQKTLYASITSVLSLEKEKPGYKKPYKFYYDKMMDKSKTAKIEGGKIEANEKQTENWLTWEEVIKKLKELKDKTTEFSGVKHLSPEQFHTLLSYLILSLYVEVPPRRNQDYLHMRVFRALKKDKLDELPKDKNYLIVLKGVPTEFIFNVYKTSKTYGQQRVAVPETLREVINLYLKHLGDKAKEFNLLRVGSSRENMEQANAITRVLNKTFGKKIGSSMLRHIYLSSKYDVTDMAKDATEMGHSLEEQRAYLKAPPEPPAGLVAPK